ncbi:putative cytochrome P450 [Helianthus debilis subsp. tardiflorus]
MDLLLPLIIFVVSILCFFIFSRRINNGLGVRTPEAAGSWPIIGHLHLLAGSKVTHRLLGSMTDKFGPVFTLKLGCLTTNDRVFASRPKALASELMGYNYANFGFASYGPYWHHIRKIIVHELVSQHRLQMLAHIRVSEVKSSIIDIYRSWVRNKESSETVMVDMKEWFGNLIVNMVVRMLFGDHFSSGEHNRDEFLKAIRRFVDLFGVFVPSDAIPWLRWLDLGGYEKKMKKTALEIDIVVNGWLEDHKKKMSSTSTMQEEESRHQAVFLAALLSHVKEEVKEEVYGFSTEQIVKATCLAIFVAATDTTTVTLTWALALLVNNPLVLKKAQQELENHVGRDRKVEESDMNNLVYLQAIIKETM